MTHEWAVRAAKSLFSLEDLAQKLLILSLLCKILSTSE